jgi:hypothetical protein
MNKGIFLLAGKLMLFFIITVCKAQPIVRGQVIHAVTQETLPGAHVFFNSTTLGTTSDGNGRFSLQMPAGSNELVVSFSGFESQIIRLAPSDGELFIEIVVKLSPKTLDFGDLEITGFRDDEWYTHLERFIRNFLGESELASGCTLTNPEVLIIHFHRPAQMLRVMAKAPLKIINPGLGYRIKYVLEEFTLDLHTRELYYAGYPHFEDMYAQKKLPKYIQKNREKASNGSIQHFLKSAMEDRLEEEGYDVRWAERIENPERPEGLDVEKLRFQIRQAESWHLQDSLSVLLRKAKLPRFITLVSDHSLRGSELMKKDEKGGYYLIFPGRLQVEYTREKEEPAFRGPFAKGKAGFQKTTIHKKADRIAVDPSGLVLAPKDLIFEGYMGWEKVGDMVPLN